MATKLLLEDRFACTPQQLFDILSDDNFDDSLMKALDIQKEVISNEKSTDGVKLSLRLTTPDPIPAVAKKIIGEKLSYVESRTWSKKDLTGTWTIEPEIKVKNIDVHGTITIVADGHGCLRRTEGTLSVGIPLIGRSIEETLLKGITDTFTKNANYCRKYIDENL